MFLILFWLIVVCVTYYTHNYTHKAHVHVLQLHVYLHHSLSCLPLQQCRAFVVDSLGLGITRLMSLYYVYKVS